MKQKNRSIYILLTRFPDHGSKVISLLTRCFYTHASIGLEEDLNTFYSFVTKGFLVEKITKYIRPDREPYPCQLYEMKVSEKTYNAELGVAFGLLHIPFVRKYRYFCSQFVAEILEKANAVHLPKLSALCFPRDLAKLPGKVLVFQGNLQTFLNRFVPQAQLLAA